MAKRILPFVTFGLSLTFLFAARANAANASGGLHVIESIPPYQWGNVAIGGGGWMTCLVPHPSVPDLLWLGSDVAGPWKREPGSNRWQAQCWNRWTPANASGVLGLAVDPRDAATVYAERGDTGGSMGPPTADLRGLYATHDGGRTWTLVLNKYATSNAGESRKWGPSIIVDPNQPGVVYWGTFRDGIWRSVDAGKTWAQVMAPPALKNGAKSESLDPGVRCLAVDPTVKRAGRSAIVYASLAGDPAGTAPGLYRSTDGGDSFAQVPGFDDLAGHPRQVRFMYCGSDGTLYVNHELGLARLGKDGFRDITPQAARGFDEGGLAVNPRNASELLLIGRSKKKGEGAHYHSAIFRSRDGGGTWTSVANDDGGIIAENLPAWLTKFNAGLKMPASPSFVAFDPNHAGRAYLLDAFGVYRIDDVWADKVKLHSLYEGVENTVVIALCTPPASADGNAPCLLSGEGDVRGFRHADISQPPLRIVEPESAAEYDWCTYVTGYDYCEGNPDVIMCAKPSDNRRPGKVLISVDGGQTWQMTSYPVPGTNTGGSKIAVSAKWQGSVDTLHAVFVPGAKLTPRYTHDGGKTWSICKTVDGAPLPHASILDHPFSFGQFAAADRVDADTFYIYNTETGSLWVSRDGGATWKEKPSIGAKVPDYDSFSPCSIQAAPGRAGEIWAAMSNAGIKRSRDFGDTWESLPGVVKAGENDPANGRPCLVAFGAPAPGKPANEPTVYVYVKPRGESVPSLLRSSDIAKASLADFTWERVQKWDFGGIRPSTMQGSRQKYGQVFMGASDYGVIYGEMAR